MATAPPPPPNITKRAGLGRNLTADEVDANFQAEKDALAAEEAQIAAIPAGATGATGAAGATGPAGAQGVAGLGASYIGTSATSIATSASGSKAMTTLAGLAYTVGSRVRATSVGTGEWMEGVVTAYVGTLLTFTADSASGSGTHADWNLNVSGQAGAPGATGATGQTGTTGTTGGVGLTGPASIVPGPTGLTGPAGGTGLTGAAGGTGLTGPQGTAGAAGGTGLTGAQGVTGAAGAAGTYSAFAPVALGVGAVTLTSALHANRHCDSTATGDVTYPMSTTGATAGDLIEVTHTGTGGVLSFSTGFAAPTGYKNNIGVGETFSAVFAGGAWHTTTAAAGGASTLAALTDIATFNLATGNPSVGAIKATADAALAAGTVLAIVTGTRGTGNTLTATVAGGWAGTYQWQSLVGATWTNVASGGTSATHVELAADRARDIRCIFTPTSFSTAAVHPAAPAFTAQSAPAAAVGVAYNYGFVADGAVSYAVGSGSLPAGVTLNTGTGVISGTPTTAGTATFTISATNPGGTTSSSSQSVVITGSATVLAEDTFFARAPFPSNWHTRWLASDGVHTWYSDDISEIRANGHATSDQSIYTDVVGSTNALHELTCPIVGEPMGLFVRFVDAANHISTRANITANKWDLVQTIAGAGTLLDSIAGTPANGDVIGIEVTPTGVTMIKNGTRGTTAATTVNASEITCGWRCDAAEVGEVSHWKVTGL